MWKKQMRYTFLLLLLASILRRAYTDVERLKIKLLSHKITNLNTIYLLLNNFKNSTTKEK